MDNVLCDFTKSHNEALKRTPEIKYPQSQYGFWRNLQPIDDAIESVNFLISRNEFDVYILTAPSILNPLCYTEKRLWIEDYFGLELVNKLIISPNKGLNKGEYLIDDMNSGKGQENFEGTLLQFGSDKYPNWTGVINYFKKEYNIN